MDRAVRGCGGSRTARTALREPDHGEAAFGGEFHCQGIRIAAGVVDFLDTGVHDHLHAHQAWLMGAVDGSACDGDPVVGGLDDGVLLRVKRTLTALAAVHDPDEASYVLAVGHPRRAAVVACGQDAFVAHDHGPDSEPRAC